MDSGGWVCILDAAIRLGKTVGYAVGLAKASEQGRFEIAIRDGDRTEVEPPSAGETGAWNPPA